MPPSVLGMGAAAGAAASLALFAFQASLRHGKISTSWLVLNLCIAVPILISILVYGEALTAGKGVGVAMVFAAILLMWWDKRIDQARSVPRTCRRRTPARWPSSDGDRRRHRAGGRPDRGHPDRASKTKWLSLIMLAFLANGLAASSQKVLVELGDGDFAWQFYVVLYAAGAAVVAVANAFTPAGPTAARCWSPPRWRSRAWRGTSASCGRSR